MLSVRNSSPLKLQGWFFSFIDVTSVPHLPLSLFHSVWAMRFILTRAQNSSNFFTAVSLLILLLETAESYCKQKVLQNDLVSEKKLPPTIFLPKRAEVQQVFWRTRKGSHPPHRQCIDGCWGRTDPTSKSHQLLGPSATVAVVYAGQHPTIPLHLTGAQLTFYHSTELHCLPLSMGSAGLSNTKKGGNFALLPELTQLQPDLDAFILGSIYPKALRRWG